MTTTNSLLIRADPEALFRAAAEVERWPEILAHYRSVEVLGDGPQGREVRMTCVRRFGPLPWRCRWRALQSLHPREAKIGFLHLAGPARGMRVEWSFVPERDGVLASIRHEFDPGWAGLGAFYSQVLVGRLFVSAIANRTLEGIRRHLEEHL